MIARMWRGWTTAQDEDAYVDYLIETGTRDYRNTPGNEAAYILRRQVGGRTEFTTLTFWDSMDAIRGFARGDITVKATFTNEALAAAPQSRQRRLASYQGARSFYEGRGWNHDRRDPSFKDFGAAAVRYRKEL